MSEDAASLVTAPEYPHVRGWATRIKPGQTLNPAGRPQGARSRYSEAFCDDLLTAWVEGGLEALRKVRDKDPSTFVRVAASLIPKQSAHIRANVSTTRPLDAVNADLVQAVRALGFTVTPSDTESVPATGGASEAVAGLTQSSGVSEIQEQPLADVVSLASESDVHEHGGQPSNSSVHDKS